MSYTALLSKPKSPAPTAKSGAVGGLRIGEPNDVFEQEADRIAEEVMAGGGAKWSLSSMTIGPPLQRKCSCGGSGECHECKEKTMQRKADSHAKSGYAPPIVDGVLRSPGRPLERNTQEFFERRLGHDFSAVRVHTDPTASASVQAVNASAYTVGHDIVIPSGHYASGTGGGLRLLAHELTHVVQQGAAGRLAAGAASPRQIVKLASNRPSLQRFGHEKNCTEERLKSLVWPGDHLAKDMLEKAIQETARTPPSPLVEKLFERFFMTKAPDLAAVTRVLGTIEAAFAQNDYAYSCDESCSGTALEGEKGYVSSDVFGGHKGPIHLCTSHLQSYIEAAKTILHEFGHRYVDLDLDTYCETDCPKDLKAEDALKNTDSYARFAQELYFKSIEEAQKKKDPSTP